MRALVTGGAGFIGSNLVKLLRDAGHDVVVLDNLSSGYRENLTPPSAHLIQGDVRDAAVLNAAVEGCEVVFHLAASVGNTRSIEHPIADLIQHVAFSTSLVDRFVRMALVIT